VSDALKRLAENLDLPPKEAGEAILAFRAEVLREAADYLTKTYGATNRAASSLRRLAELEAQKGL